MLSHAGFVRKAAKDVERIPLETKISKFSSRMDSPKLNPLSYKVLFDSNSGPRPFHPYQNHSISHGRRTEILALQI